MQEPKNASTKLRKLSDKLKRKQIQNRKLRNRIRDLERSRKKWRSKCFGQRDILKGAATGPMSLWGDRPARHRYGSMVICMALWFREHCNCSLRSCAKILGVLSTVLGLGLKTPSHVSINNWERKHGRHRILQAVGTVGGWVLILDESINIAQQRILLLLGHRADRYSFGRPLCLGDVEVLDVGVARSWTELCIGQRIRALQAKGHVFVNGISDGGKAIVKALAACGVPRTADCTHYIGGLLEKQYKKDSAFQAFSRLCGQLKKELMNGQYAHWIPPSQRAKGRFLNLFELGAWAERVLHVLEARPGSVEPGAKGKLELLLPSRGLVHEIAGQCRTAKELFAVLKSKGLDRASKQACEEILANSSATGYFKQGVQKYLDDNIREGRTVGCCSDVIESCFGKYKNRLPTNKLAGFGLGCLSIANMGQRFSLAETKSAMENVAMKDLWGWAAENLCPNVLQKRKNLLKLQEVFLP